MNLVQKLKNRTTFIVGSEKNAGKTTFLNYALSCLRREGRAAFLTIGIDGEKTDQLFGNPKPQIKACSGDIFVTADTLLSNSDGKFEILEVFPGKTVLGRMVLAKTVREGSVELSGPENNESLSEILATMRQKHSADTILVDGAANRITQTMSAERGSYILVIRAEREKLHSAIEAVQLAVELAKVPEPAAADADRAVPVRGALTASRRQTLPQTATTLLFEDASKIFLSLREWRSVAKKYSVFFERTLELSLIVVNLRDITQDEFCRELNSSAALAKIVFNPYAELQP